MTRSQVLRVGLTGGIGSGKSTVAAMLSELGAYVIDTDEISRRLTGPDGGALPAISKEFGSDYIAEGNVVDRAKMRALVFQDPEARRRLENILHPLIGLEVRNLALTAEAQGESCIIFDIPLLVESGRWRPMVDWVLVVDCEPEIQVTRVVARSQLTRPEVERIMAQQASRARRLGAADFVLVNIASDLETLRHSVRSLAPHFGLSFGGWEK